MSEVIHVYLAQKRYQTPSGMSPGMVSRFIHLMEQFADDLGLNRPTIQCPEGSHSLRFEFEVSDE